ncbi:MAG: sigma-70 family RNA polymerase sigma factor [Nannocystaceae bacterium]|nr:sigma-70 family RNA polymerase sigma factor [Nannocystaceae bacterium]
MAVDVESLYRKYGPFVLRRCRAMLHDEEQALEVMQDVFLQILRRADTLEDRGLGGLLATTSTNLCLNRLRSGRRRPSTPNTEYIERVAAAGHEMDQVEARSLLNRVFKREPKTQVVALLHYGDGLTLEQTATATGLSLSGVRFRLRKLKHVLEELGSNA